MKKLLVLFVLLITSFIGFGQCNEPTGGVATWYSSTHNYYAPNSPYKFSATQPNPPVEWVYWFGAGTNNYRITAPSGDVPFNYTWRIGSGVAGNGTSGVSQGYLLRSSNGKASSVTTNLGLLSTSDFEVHSSFPTWPPFQNPLTLFQYYNDPAPGVERTLTIPANPYSDRSLTFGIASVGLVTWQPGCSIGVTNIIDFGYDHTPSYLSPFRIDQMFTPWVEITIPPATKPEFVNAGAPTYLASGGPQGAGTVLTVPYPTVTSGNLLLLVLTNRNASFPVGPPAGWTPFTSAVSNNSGITIYYKISNGTESGNVTVNWTVATTNNRNGRIFQFKNALPTAYNVNTLTDAGGNAVATFSPITSTATGELAMSFIYSAAGVAINTYTGGNLTWNEPVADSRGLGLNVASYSTIAINSGTATQIVTNNRTLNFTLKSF